jgi:Ca2+-binding RTX toxin-like protein
MSHKLSHGWRDVPIQELASQYLAQDGLTFDFDAGRERYDYQVSIGDEGNDALVGRGDRDHFWGLGGNDLLNGDRENDVLYGDSGADTLSGGDGADRLTGGMDGDRLYGGRDADALMGGMGNDYLDEGAGHGDLEGGMGDDTLVGGLGPDAFAVDPTSGNDVIRDFTAGPGMFDHLALRDLRWEDLSFEDTPAGVRVSWQGGSVLLEGVRQADLAQDDFMFAEEPDLPPASRPATAPTPERPTPSVEGPDPRHGDLPGERFDQAADAAMRDGDVALTFTGDETYQVLVGEREADQLTGGESVDNIFGRDGADTLLGAGGDDVLQGDAGDDRLEGGDGMDRLDGGMGADTLTGGAMVDDIMGMEGADSIDAGAGHDMIEGGMGNDTITGGTGADAFIVDPHSGFDVITDMEVRGEAQGAFDHLALRDIRPDQVSVVDRAEGAFVSWNTDRDADPEGGVLLQGVFKADLRQSDFMFVEEPGFVPGISTAGSDWIFPG